jgi:hypothetical protein
VGDYVRVSWTRREDHNHAWRARHASFLTSGTPIPTGIDSPLLGGKQAPKEHACSLADEAGFLGKEQCFEGRLYLYRGVPNIRVFLFDWKDDVFVE